MTRNKEIVVISESDHRNYAFRGQSNQQYYGYRLTPGPDGCWVRRDDLWQPNIRDLVEEVL